jgi:hypothetical protein
MSSTVLPVAVNKGTGVRCRVSHAVDTLEIRFFTEMGAKSRKSVLNVCNFLDGRSTGNISTSA